MTRTVWLWYAHSGQGNHLKEVCVLALVEAVEERRQVGDGADDCQYLRRVYDLHAVPYYN